MPFSTKTKHLHNKTKQKLYLLNVPRVWNCGAFRESGKTGLPLRVIRVTLKVQMILIYMRRLIQSETVLYPRQHWIGTPTAVLVFISQSCSKTEKGASSFSDFQIVNRFLRWGSAHSWYFNGVFVFLFFSPHSAQGYYLLQLHQTDRHIFGVFWGFWRLQSFSKKQKVVEDNIFWSGLRLPAIRDKCLQTFQSLRGA